MIYFTSDTHFGHKNVIEYCSRPFSSVEEMDAEIVRRWNARVGTDDTVYHLGDFAFGPKGFARSILEQLKGRVILVRGNHDGSASRCRDVGFAQVADRLELDAGVEEGPITLTHEPCAYAAADGLYLNGHVHEAWKVRRWVTRPDLTSINVGVDQWGFEPKTLPELLAGAR